MPTYSYTEYYILYYYFYYIYTHTRARARVKSNSASKLIFLTFIRFF